MLKFSHKKRTYSIACSYHLYFVKLSYYCHNKRIIFFFRLCIDRLTVDELVSRISAICSIEGGYSLFLNSSIFSSLGVKFPFFFIYSNSGNVKLGTFSIIPSLNHITKPFLTKSPFCSNYIVYLISTIVKFNFPVSLDLFFYTITTPI